jgi:hypothetical protein
MKYAAPISRLAVAASLALGGVASAESMEPFEPGDLPELAVNLGGLHYYSRGHVFANALMLEDRGWRFADDAKQSVPFDQLDADGYPTALGGRTVFAAPFQNNKLRPAYPLGRYVVTWEGEGDVVLPGDATLVEGSAEANRRVYDVTKAAGSGLRIELTGADGENRVRDVRVWMPDPTDPQNSSLEPADGEPEPLFHPLYVEHINADPELFGVLRFMDWLATNQNAQETWDDRRPPNYAMVTRTIDGKPTPGANGDKPGKIGLAWEHVIAFANETDKHAWINVPHAADDEYVRNLAKLIRFGSDAQGNPYEQPQDQPVHAPLKDDLRVWVEHSNEIWSGGGNFPQGDWAEAEGEKLGLSKAEFNAVRAAQIWQIFNEVFAEDANRIVRPAMAWTGQIDRYTRPYLERLVAEDDTTPTDTAPHFLSTTTYFGQPLVDYAFNNKLFMQVEDYNDPSDPAINRAFDYLLNDLVLAGGDTGGERTNALGGIGGANMALAEEFGLPLVSYEGNTSMYTEGRNWMMRDKGDLENENINSGWQARQDTSRERVFSVANHVNENYPDDDDRQWNDDRLTKLIRAVNEHPRMIDVYRAHLALAKSVGLHTHGVFVDISGGGKHGHWGHKTSMYQPVGDELGEAVKWHFLQEWQAEQKDINELGVGGETVGSRPSLPPAGVVATVAPGERVSHRFDVTDGELSLIAAVLPKGVSFDGNSLTGVVANDEESGIYRLLLRALDADGDVAYAIYAVEVTE